MIEGELQALLPGIIDVGEPEQVPGHLAGGVIAAVLARGVHARDPERLDLLGFRGLAMAREIQELALEIAGDAAREFLAVELQRAGEPRDLLGGERQLARIHPHRVHGRADRERLAVAVGDGAAVRGDVEHAREARIALAGEKTVIDELQVHRTPRQRQRAHAQEALQQVRPPAERARRELACAAHLHGAMISISFGGGIAMWSLALATRSTKAWVDQALCSSCS